MSVDQIAPQPHTSLRSNAAVFVSLFLLVVLLQWMSGAYRSEFGGYPDEPAHYATSVMVRDYILSGHYSSPMQFAANYYRHYPKIAFGHWPPLLYAIQGLWMVLFSESRASVLLELALSTATAAYLLFWVARRFYGFRAGVLSAVLLTCLPIIQVYSNEEMAESLLLITTFCSALFFFRYLENHRWQDSFWFGIFCSLAILTKGNGWALVMIPPIAILLTRQWLLLRTWAFWIPVPVVGLLCMPWQVMTLEMAQRGWTGGAKPNVPYTLQALAEFAYITKDLVGWAILLLAALGFVYRIILAVRTKSVRPVDAVMFGLIFSMWVFHSVVPAGVEARKLINALPGILLFALAGGQWLGQAFSARVRSGSHAYIYPAIAASAVVFFCVETFTVPKEQHYGFTELSSYIESQPELKDAVILVSSEWDGEGLLISELMMQDRRPGHTVLRANKLLSSSDWTGKATEILCSSTGELMQILTKKRVRAVVLDTYPKRQIYRHNELILEAIRAYPDQWRLRSTFGDGKIQIYDFL